MGKHKKRNIILMISIVLMLLSCIFTSMIQTNFGSITVKEINWVTDNGYTMNAWLFIPENATAENPAPAVVTSHGMFNNKGMQDLNFVELARRGFVVLAQDMPSHGDSGETDGFAGTMMGMYESVKELAGMPFVDATRIGITGHSLGGMSCNLSVTLDNYAPTPLIAAVLLNSADGTYTDDSGNFANVYGSRDMGIIAGQYDEWFFDDVDANGNPTLPKDFISNKNAQSILYFGQDPAGQPLREANTIYTETVDGVDAMRVIYTPDIIHPWSHFSYKSTVGTIEFFDAALDAPIEIAPTNQIWQWKVVSNTVGLIGFFMFMVALTLVLANTSFFNFNVDAPVAPRPVGKGGKVWFYVALALGVVFAAVTYFPILGGLSSSSGYIPGITQSSPNGVSTWAAACGVFAILSMTVSYFCYGKKNGVNLSDVGLKISLKNLGKTVLLAALVVASMLVILGVADYLFMADFRIWVVAFRAFKLEQLGITFAPYAFLFMVYFVANSVSVNCFNYNEIGLKNGKGKWINIALLALAAGLPAIILLLMQYIPYFSGSDLMWPQYNMYGVWLFPMLVTLPGSAVVSRIVYKHTKNPYLGGLICAVMVAIMSCTNTLTMGG